MSSLLYVHTAAVRLVPPLPYPVSIGLVMAFYLWILSGMDVVFLDGWMDRWVDRWMGGWMDAWKHSKSITVVLGCGQVCRSMCSFS